MNVRIGTEADYERAEEFVLAFKATAELNARRGEESLVVEALMRVAGLLLRSAPASHRGEMIEYYQNQLARHVNAVDNGGVPS